MDLPSPSLLFVFAIPISGSPKDLSIAAAGFTIPSPIASIGILWRKFVTSLAVCQATEVMRSTFRHDVPSIMNRVRQHFKVCWITTRPRLAKVMNFQSVWNSPTQQLVNMPVNIFPFSVNQDNPIASDSPSAGPDPAVGIRLNTDSFLNT